MDEQNNEKSGDFKIPDLNANMKRAAKTIASNLSLIIASFAIVVATMVFFTDISGGFNLSASMSYGLVILFCCCLVEYYSTKHMGTQEGKREKAYIDITKEHKEISKECHEKCSAKVISQFCLDYAEEDLIRRRKAILRQVDMDYEDYKEYIGKKFKELPKDMPYLKKLCVSKANRLKPIYISQDNLIFAVDSEKEASLLLSTTKRERTKDLIFIIPTIITTFFAASIVIEVASDLSFATVTACMVKVFCMALNAVKGYQTGYYNVVDGRVECTGARIFLLRECISRHGKKEEVKDGETKEQTN